MTTLPQTGATELVQAQGAPEPAVNEIARYLDAFVARALVEDRDLTAPPVSCADGARYLVAASPTGLWTGKAGKLAIALGTNAANGWLFVTAAVEGFRLYLRDENTEIEHNGTSWGAPSIPSANLATYIDVWDGSSSSKAVTPAALQQAAVPTALTSSTSITPDGDAGLNFTLTLAHSTTLQNPSNFDPGDSGIIEITQDATGSRTMIYGTQWKFPGGAPVLSTAAGAVDVIAYFVPASGRILASLTKAFSS